jgi:hypothetical protein
MATTELTLGADYTGNHSAFIFDVTLSTAIAANGEPEAQAPVAKGPLSPDMLDKMNRHWRAATRLTSSGFRTGMDITSACSAG